ncbi:hypothetical protein [Mycobacterium sp. PS03-16]|uniref:hypothetical protein n=1 Tax=Mycobacterium sp. PS03-16 TaxID=2559611 RepID=UPI001FD8063C|nr:hypothetical protein [Mycobacterium sp. PS03-16]
MSTAASRAGALCGVLVGACSGLLAVGAHAAAGGGVPTGPTLVLVALACATVGAVAGVDAAVHGTGRTASLVAAVGGGQLLGHVLLGLSGGHHGGHGLVPSAPMLIAHALAALGLGLLIGLAGHLYVVCASLLCWLSLTLVHRGRPPGPPVRTAVSLVVQSVRLCSGLGMRAPPQAVAIGG